MSNKLKEIEKILEDIGAQRNVIFNCGTAKEALKILKELQETHVLVPKEQSIAVSKEGIRFGRNCWLSHGKILNRQDVAVGKEIKPKGIVETQYIKFIKAMIGER